MRCSCAGVIAATVLLLLMFAPCGLTQSSDPKGPQQIHLALTSDPTQMRVNWASMVPYDEMMNVTVMCLYGLVSGNYTMAAPAKSYTYTAGGFNGTLHDALMTNLNSAFTRYFYLCGSLEYGFSEEFVFTTPPFPLTQSTVSFLAFGDMGVNQAVKTVAGLTADAQAPDSPYTLVLNVGDSSYADDYDARTNAKVQDAFYQNLQGFTSRMPMMLVDGNHDIQFEYAAFLNRTHMIQTDSTPLSRFYFSFDYGPVHFLVFSTDGGHSTAPNSTEWLFMQADLQAADLNRHVTPWIVVISHHPLYCSELVQFPRCHSEADVFKANYEDLLYTYGVDLYLCGHNHQYERSYPVYHGIVNQSYVDAEYPVYIVNGAAGDLEGIDPTWEPDVDFRAFHSSGFDTGYARMHVNRTALSWEYVNADEMEVIDHFTMVKTDPLLQSAPDANF